MLGGSQFNVPGLTLEPGTRNPKLDAPYFRRASQSSFGYGDQPNHGARSRWRRSGGGRESGQNEVPLNYLAITRGNDSLEIRGLSGN